MHTQHKLLDCNEGKNMDRTQQMLDTCSQFLENLPNLMLWCKKIALRAGIGTGFVLCCGF